MVEAGLTEVRCVAVDEGSSSSTATKLSRSSSWECGDDGYLAGALEPLSGEQDAAASAAVAGARGSGRCTPPQEQPLGEQEGDQSWAVGLSPCTPDVPAPPPSRGGGPTPAPLWLGGGWAVPPPLPLQPSAAVHTSGALPAAAATAAEARGYVCQVVARLELIIAAADGSVVTPRRQLPNAAELEAAGSTTHLQYAAELEAAGSTAAPAADA